MISCMSNGKDTIIHLTVGLIKKTLYKNQSMLSSSLEVLEKILMLKVDLSNYAKKLILKR